MNDEFTKDFAKSMSNNNTDGELVAGATPRRYEPAAGINSHNKRIHRESDFVDKYKDLPFSFSKPKKGKKRAIKVCSNCGEHVYVNKITVGIICKSCNTFAKVEEINIEEE